MPKSTGGEIFAVSIDSSLWRQSETFGLALEDQGKAMMDIVAQQGAFQDLLSAIRGAQCHGLVPQGRLLANLALQGGCLVLSLMDSKRAVLEKAISRTAVKLDVLPRCVEEILENPDTVQPIDRRMFHERDCLHPLARGPIRPLAAMLVTVLPSLGSGSSPSASPDAAPRDPYRPKSGGHGAAEKIPTGKKRLRAEAAETPNRKYLNLRERAHAFFLPWRAYNFPRCL